MRRVIPLLAAMLMAGPAARAQVTVDLRALRAVPPGVAAPVAAPARQARPVAPRPVVPHRAPRPSAPVSAAVASHKPAPRVALGVPVAAPPVIPAAVPPPPPAALTRAAPAAPRAPAPLHLGFAPGAGFLSPAWVRAIGAYVRAAPPRAHFAILAYAPASAQNPSAARELALARALAVHDALRAAGVAPRRIRLRAMDPGAGGTDNDRAVIAISFAGSAP